MGSWGVRGLLIAGSSMVLVGAAPAARTQEGPPPEAQAITQALTAAQLADWGRRHHDAGALVMAARLAAEVRMRRGPDSDADSFLSPDALLDEALAMAPDDAAIEGAVARLRRIPKMRTGVRSSPFGQGPIYTVKALQAGEVYAFDVDARSNEILRVAAIGDGDTDIDLSVRDTRGVVVCRDGFGDHYPVCTVAPREPGKLRVDITNRGEVWTRVQILSN
jgi:hypothetical protein